MERYQINTYFYDETNHIKGGSYIMKTIIGYGLTLLKKQKKQIVTSALTVIAVIAVILAIFFKGYTSATKKYGGTINKLQKEVERLSDSIAIYEEASREVNIRVINADIQNIGELATIEYFYTDAGKFEDPATLFGKDIPFAFTTKSFIVKWDGSIKAGVDISKVKAEVNEAAKEIIVHIPKAEIFSHEIKDESIETLDEKNGLFNKLKVEDVREFDAISKDTMEQRAIENGLLVKAFDNAKKIIYKLINTDTVAEAAYTITFKIIDE